LLACNTEWRARNAARKQVDPTEFTPIDVADIVSAHIPVGSIRPQSFSGIGINFNGERVTESSTLETRRLAARSGADFKDTQVIRCHVGSVLLVSFIIAIGADIAREDSREPRNHSRKSVTRTLTAL